MVEMEDRCVVAMLQSEATLKKVFQTLDAGLNGNVAAEIDEDETLDDGALFCTTSSISSSRYAFSLSNAYSVFDLCTQAAPASLCARPTTATTTTARQNLHTVRRQGAAITTTASQSTRSSRAPPIGKVPRGISDIVVDMARASATTNAATRTKHRRQII